MPGFKVKVVCVRACLETYFLQRGLRLSLFLLLLPLLLLVYELAVIDDLAYWRIRLRCDLNKI